MFENEPTLLCPGADDIACYIGNEKTIALGNATKFKTLYIPRGKLPDGHFLVKTIGRLWAEILQAEYGGESISVPKCTEYQRMKRNHDIKQDAMKGMTPTDIMRKHKVSATTLRRIVAPSMRARVASGAGSSTEGVATGGKSSAE